MKIFGSKITRYMVYVYSQIFQDVATGFWTEVTSMASQHVYSMIEDGG